MFNIYRGLLMNRTLALIVLFCMASMLHARELQVIPTSVDDYGTIDETVEHMIDDAILEKVTIHAQKNRATRDIIKRKGVLIRREGAKANILMCHGFMCNKFDVGFVRSLFGQEYNFLAFDFRAHGEVADGQVCTFGRDESLDVLAGAEFLKHHPEIGQLPLFVYGFSMGAASAIEAQANYPYLFKGMILDCPFDSTSNVLKRSINTLTFNVCGYEFYVPGRRLLHKYAFHPYIQAMLRPILKAASRLDAKQIEIHMCHVYPHESIKKVDIPCLFICCKQDELVSMDAIKAVYDGAQGYKKLWVTNGRYHCDSFFYNPECYSKRLKKFMHAVLDGKIKKKRNKIVEDMIDLGCGGEII